MTSTTLLDWQPPADFLTWVRPVQVEDASEGLTGCSLPTGEGILMWPSGAEVHYAILDSLTDALQDDIVTAPMIETAFTAGEAIYRTSVFTVDGEVFFSALGSTSSPTDMFWVKIYKADDPTDPTAGWSLHGTVHSGVLYPVNLDFGGTLSVGIPCISEGRWVMQAAKAYSTFDLGGYCGRDAGIWTSDDGGATWTIRKEFLQGTPAHWAPQSAPQMALDPATGKLTTTGSIDANFVDSFVSANNGTSWSAPGYTNDSRVQVFIDNGTNCFALQYDEPNGEIWRLDGTSYTEVAEIWDAGAMGSGIGAVGNNGQTCKFIIDGDLSLYYFVADYVAAQLGCIPVHPDPLFIPYKNRLEQLVRDFTEANITRAVDQQGQNLRAIEEWAHRWVDLVATPDRCRLFIPYKDHAREAWDISARQSFDNWKAIERWAFQVFSGECGCNCTNADPPADSCFLFIPHKDALASITDPTNLSRLALVSEWEFDNFKALERWAGRYASGECGCTV